METLTLQERLLKIQTELKAPKNKYNAFGKYNYRNLEGILEASKPLLLKYGVNLILSDETIEVAGFPICNAKAKIFCSDYPELSIEVQAQGGVDFSKKGMDWSQASGSASSYARKYALNGLFLIDDTEDADATNKHEKKAQVLNKSHDKWNDVISWLKRQEDFDKAIGFMSNRYTISQEDKKELKLQALQSEASKYIKNKK
jgi:hypothetical protein